MKDQIQIASEPKDSNLASTLAHETRKNNAGRILFLSLCVVIVIAVSTVFTSCDKNGEKDGEKSVASALIGKWEALYPNEDGEIYGFVFTENTFQTFSNEGWESDKFGFVIDGNMFVYSFSTTELPQTWQVTGDILTLTYPYGGYKEDLKKVTTFSWE